MLVNSGCKCCLSKALSPRHAFSLSLFSLFSLSLCFSRSLLFPPRSLGALAGMSTSILCGGMIPDTACVSQGGDVREMARVGKSILGPHGAWAVSGSRVFHYLAG